MKISIIGATSYLGFNLIELISKQHPDIVLKIAGRNATKLEYLKKKYVNIVSLHQMNIGDDLNEIIEGCDACVDLSYQISGIPSQLIKSSMHHGRNLIKTCQENKVKNLVIIGSVGIYGEPVIKYKYNEAPLPNEVKPNSLYGRVKLIVEKEAWQNYKKNSTNLFLVRSGHIFGAGSKMVVNLVQKLINNEPVLLKDRSAFSNATTTSGLCKSIMNLAFNKDRIGRFCANHVDLSEIKYEELVNRLAEIAGVRPNVINHRSVAKKKFNTLSIFKKYQGQISLLQSKIGLYDFGFSAFLMSKYKPNFSSYKINETLSSTYNIGLENLYAADKIKHTKEICGEVLDLKGSTHLFNLISSWVKKAGYSL